MRQERYEVQIVDRNGVAYAEQQIAGKTYIRAVAGEEYKVKVKVHTDASGCYPFACAKAYLSVDGVKLRHSIQMDVLNNSHTYFCGYNTDKDIRQSFKFSSPAANGSAGTNTQMDCTETGTFKVTIFEAEPSDRLHCSNRRFDKGPSLPSVREDKKFWQQASLETARGTEVRRKPSTNAFYHWNRLRQEPDVTLTLHYHTSEMIDFLAAMHMQKEASAATAAPAGPPVHIDLSTQREEIAAEPTPAPVIDLTHDEQVKVKREKTSGEGGGSNKRRRSSLGSGSSSSGAPPPTDVVDLC